MQHLGKYLHKVREQAFHTSEGGELQPEGTVSGKVGGAWHVNEITGTPIAGLVCGSISLKYQY